MNKTRLELAHGCWLEHARMDDGKLLWCDLTYVEHQADHWYSDSKTDVGIDEEAARKIVAFLRSAYPGV